MVSYQDFLPYTQQHLEGRKDALLPHQRSVISAAMLSYLKRVGAPKASLDNAKLLATSTAKVVVTGQQAGLLSGPAFSYYKIHSAIGLAKEHHTLECPVLPVFWVASQDHDTLEINHATVLDTHEQQQHISLDYPINTPSANIALEGFASQYNPWLEQIKAPAHLHIQAHDTPASLMVRELLEAFAHEGLLVIDPMAPEFAPLFLPHLQRELEQPLASSQAINQQAQFMRQAGLKPALTRAQGASNLFWQGDDGQRRLLHQENQLTDGVSHWSTEQLWKLTLEQPHRLTPAAGLRPVLQNAVLPTLAFVVGPGELKYVAELSGVYALHGVEPAVVVPRAHITVLEPPMVRLTKQYQLDPWLFQANWEQHLIDATASTLEPVQRIKEAIKSIETTLAALDGQLATDSQLQRALSRTKYRLNHELERLSRKVSQQHLRDQARFGQHVQRLKLHLYPNMPQERLYPFMQYRIKHGVAALEGLKRLPTTGKHVIAID